MNELPRLVGTAACDPATGRPLVLYHGTPFSFETFEQPTFYGTHFGSYAQACRREREKGREIRKAGHKENVWNIHQVALDVKQPLVLADDPRNWNNWNTIVMLCIAAGVDIHDFISSAQPKTLEMAAAATRDKLRELGYDAIVYRNCFETKNGGKAVDWSWIALDVNSIVKLDKQSADFVNQDTTLFGTPDPRAKPLDLYTDSTQIPAAQTISTCELKYMKDREAFLKTTIAWMKARFEAFDKIEMQNEFRGNSQEYPAYCRASTMIGAAKANIRIDAPVGRVFISSDDIAPVSTIFSDFLVGDIENADRAAKDPTSTNRLSFDVKWQPGEHLENYIERLDRYCDRFVDVIHRSLPAFQPNQEPSPRSMAL